MMTNPRGPNEGRLLSSKRLLRPCRGCQERREKLKEWLKKKSKRPHPGFNPRQAEDVK